jgi:HlyD family secretion protein
MTRTAVLAASVLIAGAALLGACSRGPKTMAEPPPRAVRVARIQMQPLASTLTVSGLLTSREEAAVTSELSGFKVSKVLVDQGDWVRAGQPLAQLDDALLRAQIDQQKAVLVQQQLAADRAESQARNVAGLDDKGILSQEDLDSRRFSAKSARAAAQAAAAQLADLNTREARLTLRAPVAGLVLARNVRPGDLPAGSSASQPLFLIARDGLIEVDAEVPEADLNKVREGQAVQVALPDGAVITGRVRLISPQVDPQTKLGRARIALPIRKDLRPGGYASAHLADLKSVGLTAPENAVSYAADGAAVLTLDATDHVHRVVVKTGVRSGGLVELLQGPPVGTRVLVSGASFVLDGDKVAPVPDGASQ